MKRSKAPSILVPVRDPKFIKQLGQQIRYQRKKAGLTAKDLAKKAYVYPVDISEIENGKVPNVSLRKIQQIATALEIPLKDLF